MTPRVHVDVPPVTPDEACELVAYHLLMAAAYFEATPDDGCIQLVEELARHRKLQEPGPWPWWAPAVDFIRGLHHEYEKMENRGD